MVPVASAVNNVDSVGFSGLTLCTSYHSESTEMLKINLNSPLIIWSRCSSLWVNWIWVDEPVLCEQAKYKEKNYHKYNVIIWDTWWERPILVLELAVY